MKRRMMLGLVVVFSSVTAYAHGPGEGTGAGMMGWGYGMGWFWPVLMTVFWIALIAGIVFLIRWLVVSTRTREHGGFGESAIEILKKRYARGEITKGEFESMKKDIGG